VALEPTGFGTWLLGRREASKRGVRPAPLAATSQPRDPGRVVLVRERWGIPMWRSSAREPTASTASAGRSRIGTRRERALPGLRPPTSDSGA